MRIKDVVTLKEVVSDLNDGKAFLDLSPNFFIVLMLLISICLFPRTIFNVIKK